LQFSIFFEILHFLTFIFRPAVTLKYKTHPALRTEYWKKQKRMRIVAETSRVGDKQQRKRKETFIIKPYARIGGP